jgi:hypothetical protein
MTLSYAKIREEVGDPNTDDRHRLPNNKLQVKSPCYHPFPKGEMAYLGSSESIFVLYWTLPGVDSDVHYGIFMLYPLPLCYSS